MAACIPTGRSAAEDLPADIGIEWPKAQEISSAVVRYFDGRMVGGPVMARTQQWARLQCWDHEGWKDLDAKITGQETSVVRYTFPAVTPRPAFAFCIRSLPTPIPPHPGHARNLRVRVRSI